MYNQIIKLIKKEGDKLIESAGKINDIGRSKQWLTEKDIEIERAISHLINSFDGEHKIFAEEEHAEFINSESVWIIDPISHTNNFLSGLPHYAVVVSHMIKNEIVFAAVYDPSMSEMFSAYKNKGTYLNGNKVSISEKPKGNATILFQPYKIENAGELYSELLPFGFVKSIGSMGIHYAYVACGRVEAALTTTKDMFPEFAGRLLVEEAGGTFTQFDGKEISIDSPNVFASNKTIHEELSSILKEYA